MTRHALAAKAIRQELKKMFPDNKFKVRSSSFSGGNSVDISWVDGPTEQQVKTLVSKYQYGSFDGMTGMYSDDNVQKDLPQVKWVQTSRELSDKTRALIIDQIMSKYSLDNFSEETCQRVFKSWPDQVIFQAFLNTEL